jgi:HK97 gp10 family phage protein
VSPVKDWNPQRVKAAISGQLVKNMDRVCMFVAEQAKANAPVLTGKLQRGIDYEVDARGDAVEGRVGELKGDKGGAFYAYFKELGTSKMAATPFLRPAVFDNGDTIVRMLEGGES